VGDRVRQRALAVLVVEGQLVLVPRQLRRPGGQRQCGEAVVPAPHLVHPVLGHEHGRAGEEPGGRDGGGPEHVAGEFGRGGRAVPPRGDGVGEAGEVAARRGGGAREVHRGRVGGSAGGDLLQRDLPRAAVRAHGDAASRGAELLLAGAGPVAGQERQPEAVPRLVEGEHGRPGRIGEEVRSGEGGEGRFRGGDAQAQAGAGDPERPGVRERRGDPAFGRAPREHGGIGRDVGAGAVAVPFGDERQHGVQAVPVGDHVHVVGAPRRAEHRGQAEPGAGAAERDLPDGELGGHRVGPFSP
jgi:hypothetical protein